MNRTVVNFELRYLLRDRAFLWLGVLVASAIALAALNGMRWLHFQQQTIAKAHLEESEKLSFAKAEGTAILTGAKAAPRGWWSNPADTRGFAYEFITTYAVKPPSTLTALTTGQTDLLPYYFKVNADARSGAVASYESENPRRLLLGRFDLAFVVIFILPLALLAAGYNALALEREDGRLALLMTHGVTPRRLALIRIGLRCGALLAVAAVAALGTLALGGFDLSLSGALWAWYAVAFAYCAFWVAATLLVVALVHRASSVALVLAGLWLVLVVIGPWALNLTANVLHPLPSRAEYILAQRQASDAAEARASELLGRYLHDHPEFAPTNTPLEQMHYSATDIAATLHIEAQLAPVEAAFDEQLERQQRLIDRWQWLSPAVLTQQAFNELAGAGWTRHRAFLKQTNAYIDKLRAYFNPRILKGEFTFAGFDEWPRYSWQEPEPIEARRRFHSTVLSLLLVAIAMTALAGYRFGRPAFA